MAPGTATGSSLTSCRHGRMIVMPGSRRAAERQLTAQLWNWNQRTGLGVAFDSSAGFTLPNTAIRCPDAAWMTQ